MKDQSWKFFKFFILFFICTTLLLCIMLNPTYAQTDEQTDGQTDNWLTGDYWWPIDPGFSPSYYTGEYLSMWQNDWPKQTWPAHNWMDQSWLSQTLLPQSFLSTTPSQIPNLMQPRLDLSSIMQLPLDQQGPLTLTWENLSWEQQGLNMERNMQELIQPITSMYSGSIYLTPGITAVPARSRYMLFNYTYGITGQNQIPGMNNLFPSQIPAITPKQDYPLPGNPSTPGPGQSPVPGIWAPYAYQPTWTGYGGSLAGFSGGNFMGSSALP